ncbi:uncharacterized protein M421DRAFT_96378 [Didymella exigua CBS 183.55]|uniref:Uncharacterized protein n=1 Tax=Didymella exigua CBS 183.55 TaxID=1150837 RepID=A0A6A5R7A3_9PLEO|nr:uncharacterized protein M421DRAFT_96378 [Didymella exigua CBS 183.55]KAF1923090.1 hypothetical protein M421DRAFT_96378 [Didymella exigua CBS 183.55]
MTYEHVARVAFLIDASHLTPEEVAERAANPALWAARRYGQPEHIFRAAAERHEKETAKRECAIPLNYAPSTTPFCPDTPRIAPQISVPQASQTLHSALSETVRALPVSGRSRIPGNPGVSSPSESYFSTILSSSTPDEISSSPSEQLRTQSKQALVGDLPHASGGSMSAKSKEKMRASAA